MAFELLTQKRILGFLVYINLLLCSGTLCFSQPLPPIPSSDQSNPDQSDEPVAQIALPQNSSNVPMIQNVISLRPGLQVYKYPYAAINPTPQNNPVGRDYPGYRGANQVIIYTPNPSSDTPLSKTTGTNSFGAEAIIRNGIVQSIECCNSEIPVDGMVISAHGSAGEWLKKKIQVGMAVVVDGDEKMVIFQNTPEGIVQDVTRHLETIKAPSFQKLFNHPQYQASLAKAEQCLQQLSNEATLLHDDSINRNTMAALKNHAKDCTNLSDDAYYLTVQSIPNEFRGIWLRPLEKTPEQIEQTLQKLTTLKINHIFIETYYQGRTIYPSSVMESYGLSNQHARFKGSDPLAEWITLAHQHGMKVHVWSQLFFAGNKDENAELYGPILNKHPEWANIQRATLCQTLMCKLPNIDTTLPAPGFSSVEPGHYFLDPANPDVRTFLQKLLNEMVTHYDIDGINFDYVRYPATSPVQSGSFLQSNWGYTPIARQQFIAMLEAETTNTIKPQGKPVTPIDPLRFDPIRLTPSNPLWDRWVDWRKEQISSFVQTASSQLRQIKPNLYLSAVVFPFHGNTSAQIKLQDWPRWVQSGWLNALTPIGFYPTPEGIFKDSMMFREVTQDKIPVYVGIFGAYNRLKPSEFIAQIDAAHQAGMPGIMLFENSRLSQPYRDALQQGPFRE